MKKIILKKIVFHVLALSVLIGCTAFTNSDLLRWEKLGTRMVNYDLDRDEISVTLLEGRFDAVKLIVNRSPINLKRFVIHFSNGDTQEVLVRKIIPKGGETRIIDLKGTRRGIKKVVFWYDTRKFARGRAIIELWGRH